MANISLRKPRRSTTGVFETSPLSIECVTLALVPCAEVYPGLSASKSQMSTVTLLDAAFRLVYL